ncbi:hypothetical protein MMC13_006708 [Lambiella insularis]|nr:hypothetical protein [Lambiella insularis]
MATIMNLDTDQAIDLFSRDSAACGGFAGLTTCGGGLPADFCCPSNNTCLAFNGGASAICCPPGRTCQSFQPITCDIDAFNATAFPLNPLHTTALTGSLPACGQACCPQGYACQDGQCVLGSSSSSAATSSASSTPTSKSTSTFSTSTSASTSASSATTSAASDTPSQASTTQGWSSPGLVIGVFFGGLVVGAIILALACLCCSRRRRKAKEETGDFGRVNATVSDPIYHESGATRTDFLRRDSKSKYAISPTRSASRVRSFFSRNSSIAQRPRADDVEINMDTLPRTPDNRAGGMQREPSMESIKIYSPPDARFGSPSPSRNTTFSGMMAAAGWKNHEQYGGYLGSPGRVDPRSRGVGNGDVR